MAQDYFTILTLLGKAKVADAIANGTDIDLSEIAVGDGDYTPTEGQTALVNEVHRAAANQVIRDTENTNWIIAELVIPSETGGFSVREVGIFDAAGDLFAIGKYPETYKPTFDQGSGKELVIRIILEVSNQADVTLSVDPTVVTATQDYVQGQIDEHKAESGAHAAEDLSYDNSESDLTAVDVQAAIDEVMILKDFTNYYNFGGAYKSASQVVVVRPFAVQASDGSYTIVSTADMTINLASSGAAGGLDTGSVGSTAAYYFYAIYAPGTGAVGVIASSSGSGPALPAGYTKYRLLGAFWTDGSSNILDGSFSAAGANGDFIGAWVGAQNVQADDVGGGTVAAGTWNVVPFNTQFYNCPGAYLSATGRFHLVPGLWNLKGHFRMYGTDYNLVALYNVTSLYYIEYLGTFKVDSTDSRSIPLRLNTPFQLSSAADVEIHVLPSQAPPYQQYAFGWAHTHSSAAGNNEYYARARFTKVGPSS